MKYTIRHKEQITPPFEYAKRLLQETTKPIIITVSKQKRQRSINQNAYYWLILKLIGENLGYFAEEMHSVFAIMFLKKIITLGIHSIESYRSTTKLSTVEFEEYLQNIRIFCSSELEIFIPLPNEILDEEDNY